MSHQNKLGVVIVSYGHSEDVRKLVTALQKQLKSGEKIAVVDNHPKQDTFKLFRNQKEVISLVSENLGFAHGCNVGAAAVVDAVDILTFINPDIQPKPGILQEIRSADYDQYTIVTPRILLPDGRVNANGNIVHTTGLSWCKDLYTEPDDRQEPFPVAASSGAFFAVSKAWWNKLGGLDEHYFMYYEDTDLSTKATLLGGKQVVVPTALAVHDYDFIKGTHKWLYLERNRTLYMLENWPLPVLLVLLPQNLLMELGLWAIALVQGRIVTKLKATIKMVSSVPSFLKARHNIQKQRTISSYHFLTTLSPQVDSGSLQAIFRSWPVNAFFRANYAVAKLLLWPWR